ncbi:MAG: DUF192 domain-containing protein [Proteobacteria bacterium]|nr:DUF192 domain-containing protein [Pseudomonadota bacterium]
MIKKRSYLFVILILVFMSIFVFFSLRDRCSKKDSATCRINIEGNNLKLKVAYSTKAQEHGLMGVEDLREDTGMLFVYEKPQYLSFWMKNTLIPLSIAFVEPDGKISAIYDMYPQPGVKDNELAIYPSPTPVMYAIEVPLGWFAIKNIKRNSYVKIPEKLR